MILLFKINFAFCKWIQNLLKFLFICLALVNLNFTIYSIDVNNVFVFKSMKTLFNVLWAFSIANFIIRRLNICVVILFSTHKNICEYVFGYWLLRTNYLLLALWMLLYSFLSFCPFYIRLKILFLISVFRCHHMDWSLFFGTQKYKRILCIKSLHFSISLFSTWQIS